MGNCCGCIGSRSDFDDKSKKKAAQTEIELEEMRRKRAHAHGPNDNSFNDCKIMFLGNMGVGKTSIIDIINEESTTSIISLIE